MVVNEHEVRVDPIISIEIFHQVTPLWEYAPRPHPGGVLQKIGPNEKYGFNCALKPHFPFGYIIIIGEIRDL